METYEPIIITISGKARHGKDSTAKFLLKELEKRDFKTQIVHYGDLLKYICKQYYGWNGEKDEAGRTLLQKVGTDIVRNRSKTFWVDMLIEIVYVLFYDYAYIIIPDTRFPNEIEQWENCGYKVIKVKVERTDFESELTEEQKSHPSETALDDYKFDYTLKAKDLKELKEQVNILLKNLNLNDNYDIL